MTLPPLVANLVDSELLGLERDEPEALFLKEELKLTFCRRKWADCQPLPMNLVA